MFWYRAFLSPGSEHFGEVIVTYDYLDISDSFNNKGWSLCKKDYFMTGIYRNGGGHQLYRLEEAKCCRPPAVTWGHCIEYNVRYAFDNIGWTRCPTGYYMTGQYIFFSIERFH